jgi:putative ABC transport system permease protein
MRFLRDLRSAVGVLGRRPLFFATAVVTLGLGIAANVAVFSAVRSVLLSGLPYKEPSALVALSAADHFRGLPATPVDVEALQVLPAFEFVAGCRPAEVTAQRARPTLLGAPLEVTPTFFAVWGVQPRMGRALSADDFRSGSSNAVISFEMWRTILAGDPQPVGRTITLNRQPWTIVGVMPPGFAPPCFETGRASLAWIPLLPASQAKSEALAVVARLRSDVELLAAQAQVDGLMPRLAAERGDERYEHAYLEPVGASAAAELGPGLFLLQGVGVLLLLVTCANLANLFLVRTMTRQHEMAVRAGLGARPSDLLCHVLTEAVVVSTAGAAFGVALNLGASAWLRSIAAPVLPAWVSFQIDLTDLGVAIAAGWISALAFGTIPAVLSAKIVAPRVTRANTTHITGGLLVRRLRDGLVATQVSVAVVLLVGAGLLIRSFVNVVSVPVGFETTGLVTTDLYLPTTSETELERRMQGSMKRLQEDVGQTSQRWAVAFANTSPFVYGAGVRWQVKLPGTEEFVPRSFQVRRVSSNYLDVMKIPVTRGSSFASFTRRASWLPAVASATFAQKIGQGHEIIGAELRSADVSYVVIGVAEDVRTMRLSQSPFTELYVPIDSAAASALSVVLRADSEGRAVRFLAAAAAHVNPDGPPVAVESVTSIIARSEERRWFYSVLLSLFGFLSVAVAAVGVYGVVTHAVTLRSREIGIRTALGSPASRVFLLVIRQGLRPVAIGVGAGLVTSWWLSSVVEANPVFRSLMFHVAPNDASTLGIVTIGVLTVSLVATCVPARWVVRQDPARVLRES